MTEKGTYEFQTDFLTYHLGVFAPKPFINGALSGTCATSASSRVGRAATRCPTHR